MLPPGSVGGAAAQLTLLRLPRSLIQQAPLSSATAGHSQAESLQHLSALSTLVMESQSNRQELLQAGCDVQMAA